MSDKNDTGATPPKRRRWPWIAFGALLALLLLVWLAASPFVTRKIANLLRESLAKRELAMEWKGDGWDPFRGMHLTDVKLFSTKDGERQPVAESDNLKISFSLWQFVSGGNDRVVYCAANGSKLVLTDAEGSILLEEVTLRMEVRPRKEIQITRAEAKHAGVIAEATGDIVLSPVPKPSKGPFVLRLGALRATLASLEIREGTGPFRVKGKFHVDMSGDDPSWSATAEAKGENLDYRGVLLDKAEGKVDLKSTGSSVIGATMWSKHGEVRVELTRDDWKRETPMPFHGTAKDPQGRETGFKGCYQDNTLVLERLSGSADIVELARAAPEVVKLPDEKVRLAPAEYVEVRNLRWRAEGDPGLTVESVILKGGAMVIDPGGENIEVTDLSASASHDGKIWKIQNGTALVFGGTVTASGNYSDGRLTEGKLTGENIRMAELKLPGGDDSGKERPGILSFDWRGALDFTAKAMEGAGSLRLDKAPVIQVPLLDQVYDLFATLIPGIDRSKDGSFEADFKGDGHLVRVTRFEAKGGTLTVSARGTVNLEKKRVDGQARGKLNGLPGLVTSPLSRLLEMEVGGPYDDIRVKPLGSAKLVSNAASGTVGVAVDTIEEGAKITGTVIKEGIKVPFKLFGKKEEEKK